MTDPKAVIDMYSTTYRVIKLQTEGLTHEESLMQMPFGGNCMNWALGHIMASRSKILAILNLPTVLGNGDSKRYKRGSEPITEGGEDAYPLSRILEDLDHSQTAIVEAVRDMSPDDMDRAQGDSTLGEELAFLHFHEAYHSGQLEIFRQMAGKEPQIR